MLFYWKSPRLACQFGLLAVAPWYVSKPQRRSRARMGIDMPHVAIKMMQKMAQMADTILVRTSLATGASPVPM